LAVGKVEASRNWDNDDETTGIPGAEGAASFISYLLRRSCDRSAAQPQPKLRVGQRLAAGMQIERFNVSLCKILWHSSTRRCGRCGLIWLDLRWKDEIPQ